VDFVLFIVFPRTFVDSATLFRWDANPTVGGDVEERRENSVAPDNLHRASKPASIRATRYTLAAS
jgi:hypothetical protein